jgi:hypothetical protein
MPLTGVDGNGLTSAGLVQDPVEKLRGSPCGKEDGARARHQMSQNSFYRIMGSWVVTTPGCLQRCSDAATSEAFVLLATSASRGPTDLAPVNAITTSPVAKIAPTTAFALSHRLAQDEPGAATRPVSYFTVENNFFRRLGELACKLRNF